MAAPPTGTVTFLFTDVEGSTRQARDDPVAWSAAQSRHHEIVRSAIEGGGGFVFQAVGDGFMAAFSNVDEAVAAAVSAQRGLQAERWPGAAVRARIGLHTGAAEWQNGDYRGYLTLAHAQRIMSAGHGGQILLTQTAADLALPDLSPDFALRDLGAHRLKDLPRAEHIFQLVATDLPVDFPALRSLDAFPNNLPVELTSFIGREHELAELGTLLSATRLLTLTGSGGTGKTRLALRLASSQLESYADGAWFIELASLADPTLLTQTVAGALGLQEEQGRAMLDVLLDYLRPRIMLLILDNCEHMIESCARLADGMLRAAPGLEVLATSRESLGIAGETAFRVPSLPLPDAHGAENLDRIAGNDCVRLFVDRASAADPRFQLTEKNAGAVAQICLRLDGIPLAIELAAARITVFSPDQIAARLDDRFRLLTGGSRTALERHQTLAALIDWSHDLLSEVERIVLRRLSVFAGGWSLDAAEAISGDAAGGDVVESLARLVEKSLVMVDVSSESTEARYRLLETIRQYARDKLLASGESELIRDLHLSHYTRFVEAAEHHLRSSDQLAWLDRLEVEHDNIRAALAWSLESGKAESALRLAGGTWYFWELRGRYWSEGEKWLSEALALSAGAHVPTALRAKALFGAGRLHFAVRLDPESRPIVEESLRSWRELGDKWWIAAALGEAGFMQLFEDPQTALARLEEAVALAREVDDRWPLALCLIRLAGSSWLAGVAASRRMREEALTVARSVGDRNVLSEGLQRLAFLYLIEGDLPAAWPLADDALTEARAIGSVTQIALAQIDLALISSLRGDQAAAKGYCFDMFALARETGSIVVQFAGLLASGFVACFDLDPSRGVRLLTAIERLGEEVGIVGVAGLSKILPSSAMENARTRLDPPAFEAAVQEGRTLTLEQALEQATAG
jgi:predicted ATPase/class 3 adenylate cyclase